MTQNQAAFSDDVILKVFIIIPSHLIFVLSSSISFNLQFNEITSMSLKNRLLGFGACVILGIFFSTISYAALSVANTRMFVVFYGLANIIFIAG